MSATPILDLEQPVPAAPARWPPRLLGIALGLAIAAVPVLADQGLIFDWNWPGFNGLLFIPVLLIVIAVHEAGHLVAAKLAGWDTGGISVGPVLLLRSGNAWVFQFKWRRLFSGFFKPLTTGNDFRISSCAWMIAGGPLASISLTGFSVLLFARYGNGAWNWNGTLFWSSILLGLLSMLPYSAGLQKSDGARLWQLIRHAAQLDGFRVLLTVQTDVARGLRPREWNLELVNRMMIVQPSAIEYLQCQLFLFYRFLDEGNEAAALPHLEQVLANSAKARNVLRPLLFLEAASACARIKNEPAKARVWRKRAVPLLRRQPGSFYGVDASIAMSEGRYEEALQLWQSARARMLRRKVDSGLVRFAMSKGEEFESVCREHLTARQVTSCELI